MSHWTKFETDLRSIESSALAVMLIAERMSEAEGHGPAINETAANILHKARALLGSLEEDKPERHDHAVKSAEVDKTTSARKAGNFGGGEKNDDDQEEARPRTPRSVLSGMEDDFRMATNFSEAIIMIATSNAISGQEGDAVFEVAQALSGALERLKDSWTELWDLLHSERKKEQAEAA